MIDVRKELTERGELALAARMAVADALLIAIADLKSIEALGLPAETVAAARKIVERLGERLLQLAAAPSQAGRA